MKNYITASEISELTSVFENNTKKILGKYVGYRKTTMGKVTNIMRVKNFDSALIDIEDLKDVFDLLHEGFTDVVNNFEREGFRSLTYTLGFAKDIGKTAISDLGRVRRDGSLDLYFYLDIANLFIYKLTANIGRKGISIKAELVSEDEEENIFDFVKNEGLYNSYEVDEEFRETLMNEGIDFDELDGDELQEYFEIFSEIEMRYVEESVEELKDCSDNVERFFKNLN